MLSIPAYKKVCGDPHELQSSRLPVQASGETLVQVRNSLSASVGNMEGMQGRWEIKTNHILLVKELFVQRIIQQSLSLSTYNISKCIENEKENTAQKSQSGKGKGTIQILHHVLAQSKGN